MSGWTQPIPAAHFQRDRSSLAFESMRYVDPDPPVDHIFRAPMKAPMFEPYRMPQSWVQTTPLSLSQTSVQLRAPMKAPMFWDQYLSWRQAWNAPNLVPQAAATPPTLRYHVIGSPVVRRFK